METSEVNRRYLKPPTHDQIFSFVKEVGVSLKHFEEYYGMSSGILKNVKGGFKKLPKKYWFIFFERVIPTYGSFYKFNKPETLETLETIKTPSVSKVPKIVPQQQEKESNHGRINWLKEK